MFFLHYPNDPLQRIYLFDLTHNLSTGWNYISNWYLTLISVKYVVLCFTFVLLLILFRVSARDSCLNPIEETSTKDGLQTPNVSQAKMAIASQPFDCSLTTESVDATKKCGFVMHANDLSETISTSQTSSNGEMDFDTADSKTGSSIFIDNGDCDNDHTVATENETDTNKPASIQSDVGDNGEGKMGKLSFSSSNGYEASNMNSVNHGCKPEKPVESKLKPLISSGFLSKRPQKITYTKKDENALGSENGSLKNTNIMESSTESRVVVNGWSNYIVKGD